MSTNGWGNWTPQVQLPNFLASTAPSSSCCPKALITKVSRLEPRALANCTPGRNYAQPPEWLQIGRRNILQTEPLGC